MMKSLAAVVAIGLAVGFGANVLAQPAKEGTASLTTIFSGTSKALAMGEERLHLTYEILGAATNDAGEGFLHNTSFRCIGALHAINGVFDNDAGFCVRTDADGDQIFETYQGAGTFGQGLSGSATIVGGTGKYAGITGGETYTDTLVKPATEGTFQVISEGKIQWKLP